MGKWIVDKIICEMDYGHNVWVQNLDEVLSCGSKPKCLHRHGHRGKVVAYLTSDEGLISASENMVIDFNDMKIMTKWMDDTIDHKYLIDINDPANFDTFHHFWNNETNTFKDDVLEWKEEGHWFIKEEYYMNMSQSMIDKYSSYVILPFVPTSENLAKWTYDVMSMKMNGVGVKVHKIEWYETPKSRATYYGD